MVDERWRGEYLARMETIIRELREGLALLPDGPERREMEELLGQMEQIAGERLYEPWMNSIFTVCNKSATR